MALPGDLGNISRLGNYNFGDCKVMMGSAKELNWDRATDQLVKLILLGKTGRAELHLLVTL